MQGYWFLNVNGKGEEIYINRRCIKWGRMPEHLQQLRIGDWVEFTLVKVLWVTWVAGVTRPSHPGQSLVWLVAGHNGDFIPTQAIRGVRHCCDKSGWAHWTYELNAYSLTLTLVPSWVYHSFLWDIYTQTKSVLWWPTQPPPTSTDLVSLPQCPLGTPPTAKKSMTSVPGALWLVRQPGPD